MKFLRKLQCWWLGHITGDGATYYDGYCFIWVCKRCEKELGYCDHSDPVCVVVGQFFLYWLFRKWLPTKCIDCGRRYKCDETKDHIPF